MFNKVVLEKKTLPEFTQSNLSIPRNIHHRTELVHDRNAMIDDQGISLNTILAHSIILKKDLCDLGDEFEYKIIHFTL